MAVYKVKVSHGHSHVFIGWAVTLRDYEGEVIMGGEVDDS